MASKIPNLPPLSSISDPATRAYLQALSDGWSVRNGLTGDGSEKFLTAGELGMVVDTATSAVSSTSNSVLPASISSGAASFMSQLTSKFIAVSNSITQSRIWKGLEQTIDSVAEGYSGIQTTVDTLQTDVETTVSTVTAMQTSVSGATTKAESALTLSQNINGTINGAYSVKFDVDGYVTGFGLGVDASNGTATSSFVVRADRFSVGSPGVTAVAPFMVVDGVTYINNAAILNGSIGSVKIGTAAVLNANIADAAITTAKIADAQITTAKIGDLAVDTLKIAGHAVTIPASTTSSAPSSTINFHSEGYAIQIFGKAHGVWSTYSSNPRIRLYRDGNLLLDEPVIFEQIEDLASMVTADALFTDTPGAGWHTYKVEMANVYQSTYVAQINGASYPSWSMLTLMETKR